MSRLLVLLLLAFCVCVPPLGAKEVAQDPAALAGTHGYVRVSRPQVEFRTVFTLSPLAPKTRQEKKSTYELHAAPEFGPNAYGLWVPAGQYTLVGFTGKDETPYFPITVRAGEITDLRAMVRVPLGGYELVELALAHPEAAAELAAVRARFAPHLSSEAVTAWTPTAPPKSTSVGTAPTNLGVVGNLIVAHERKVNKPSLNKQLREATSIDEMWKLARLAMRPQCDEGAIDESGNLFYAANLGQVRMRSASGEWSSLDVGTLDNITAVETHGARLVAGTVRGSLFASEDRGAHWQKIASLGNGDGIFDIDRVGNRWLIVGAKATFMIPTPVGYRNMRAVHEVRVYTATGTAMTDLAALREIAIPGDIQQWTGVTDTFAGAVHGSSYYIGAVNELLKLDVASLTWTTIQTPHKVGGFRLSGAAPAITLSLSAGIRSKLSLSLDGGTTWTEYKRPAMVFYDARFDDADHGLATRFGVGLWTATIELLEYDSRAKDWKLRYEAPSGCMQLLRDAEDAQRFCVTNGGSILVHDADAWRAEFAVD